MIRRNSFCCRSRINSVRVNIVCVVSDISAGKYPKNGGNGNQFLLGLEEHATKKNPPVL